jgi:hypothetical protein
MALVRVDDITGERESDEIEIETHELTWAGKAYSLDLSEAGLEEALKIPFGELLEKATPATGAGQRSAGIVSAKPVTRKAAASDKLTPAKKVREWAKGHNLFVNDLGPLPSWLREAYDRNLTGEALKAFVKENNGGFAAEPKDKKK